MRLKQMIEALDVMFPNKMIRQYSEVIQKPVELTLAEWLMTAEDYHLIAEGSVESVGAEIAWAILPENARASVRNVIRRHILQGPPPVPPNLPERL